MSVTLNSLSPSGSGEAAIAGLATKIKNTPKMRLLIKLKLVVFNIVLLRS